MPKQKMPEKSQATRLQSRRERAAKLAKSPRVTQARRAQMWRFVEMLDSKLAKIDSSVAKKSTKREGPMKNYAIVIAALILALAYLFGNRFEMHGFDRSGFAAFRLDRLTGAVVLCLPEGTQNSREVVCK